MGKALVGAREKTEPAPEKDQDDRPDEALVIEKGRHEKCVGKKWHFREGGQRCQSRSRSQKNQIGDGGQNGQSAAGRCQKAEPPGRK